MKDKLIQDFMKKLDASYEYKTVNERQNIITELYKIAEYEQLKTPAVSGSVAYAEVSKLLSALNDIKEWDDELEYKWEDPGYRAGAALFEYSKATLLQTDH